MRKNHAISRKTEKNMKKSRNLTHFLKNPLFLVQRCPKSGFFGRKIAFSSQIYIKKFAKCAKNMQNMHKICNKYAKLHKICKNVQKYAKFAKNVAKCAKNMQNMHKICKIVQKSGF